MCAYSFRAANVHALLERGRAARARIRARCDALTATGHVRPAAVEEVGLAAGALALEAMEKYVGVSPCYICNVENGPLTLMK